MSKVDPALQGAYHIRQVVFEVCAVGSGTESDPVMRIVHHFHHPQDVFFIDNDAWESEYAPCRIVRMDRHINVVFIADRHDPFQKIFQVCKELFIVNILVHLEEFFYMCHALRFPAGHYSAVSLAGDGFKHLFRIKGIYCFLCVGEDSGTVGTLPCQLCPCPVEDGHKIVADKMYIFFAEVSECLDVIVNIQIPVSGACFYGIMHIYALNPGYMEPGGSDFIFHGADALPAPYFARRCVIKCGDDPGNSRDLPDLLQGNSVKF